MVKSSSSITYLEALMLLNEHLANIITQQNITCNAVGKWGTVKVKQCVTLRARQRKPSHCWNSAFMQNGS